MDEDTPEVSGLMQRWGFKEDFLLTLLFLILQARKYTFDYNSANLDCCSISEDPCKDSWSQQPQLLLAKSLEQDQIKKKIHSSEQQTPIAQGNKPAQGEEPQSISHSCPATLSSVTLRGLSDRRTTPKIWQQHLQGGCSAGAHRREGEEGKRCI